MLIINYEGLKPIQDRFNYAVQGDNNTDKVEFSLKKIVDGIDLSSTNFKVYARVQNQAKTILDKTEITSSKVVDGNQVSFSFNLLAKHTQNKIIEMSISFEDATNNKVIQTRLVTIQIANQVASSTEIANTYPTIIEEMQEEINTLKAQAKKINRNKNVVTFPKKIRQLYYEAEKFDDAKNINAIGRELDFTKHNYYLAVGAKRHTSGYMKYQSNVDKKPIEPENYVGSRKRYIGQITNQITYEQLIKCICYGTTLYDCFETDFKDDNLLYLKYESVREWYLDREYCSTCFLKRNYTLQIKIADDKADEAMEELSKLDTIYLPSQYRDEYFNSKSSWFTNVSCQITKSNCWCSLYICEDVTSAEREGTAGIQYHCENVVAKFYISRVGIKKQNNKYYFLVTFSSNIIPKEYLFHNFVSSK